MARTLDQVLSDLNPYYQPTTDVINAKISNLPGQTEAAIASADASLSNANDSILNAARRRGTGIALGGLPVGEQAKYAATTYAPAVLAARTSGQDQALTLQESLNQVSRDRLSQGQSIFDNENAREFQQKQFDESVRQFNEQQAAASRAAAAASTGYGFGGGGLSSSGASTRGSLDDYGGAPSVKVNGSSYAFYDANGKPISAVVYAAQTGYGVRKLLSEMAAKGDKNASVALQYVGNDGKFGNAPASVQKSLSALGASGSYTPVSNSKTGVLSANATALGAGAGRAVVDAYNKAHGTHY